MGFPWFPSSCNHKKTGTFWDLAYLAYLASEEKDLAMGMQLQTMDDGAR